MLKNIQSHLNLTYLNSDEHTHLDRAKGSTDILDMAFISPNLTKHDIQFLIGDDLGSDHLPIEISIDAQPHGNTHTNPIRYKFDQTDREVFESTLEAALSSGDIPELKSTQAIDTYADFIVTALSTAVDKATPTSKSGRPESQPVSDETLALIKEKRRLRRQYSQAHDPLVKTRINQLQKETKDNLRIESQASWEKFCNDISLETNHTESWRKIKNFLKRKGQRDYPALRLDDREVFESTLEAALSSGDIPELKSAQAIDKYADFIVTAISAAVDKATPTSKSGRPESQPVSDETLALIKEKRRLRRQYSQAHDPLVKTRINQLQKEIKDNLRIESQASWEKFCNDISLETNHTESWRKIKNFLKPKGQCDYPALRFDAKTAKTNADKAQLFAESVERHFGIQSDNFDSKHFDEVNQFIEDNYVYFCPPEDPDDYRADMDDDHDLVADIDSDTLIRIVKFLKRGKAPGPDNIHNEVLRLGTTTSLFHHLARFFTSSIQIGHIPTAWKLAILRMLLKSDKLPSLTTSYRPISLLSSIMKLFEWVIEQRLRCYLEDMGFINISQVSDRLSLLMIISSGFSSPLWKVLTGKNM